MKIIVEYSDVSIPDSEQLNHLLTKFFAERKLLDILRRDDIIFVGCEAIDAYFRGTGEHIWGTPCLIVRSITYNTHHTTSFEKIIDVTDVECVEEMRAR